MTKLQSTIKGMRRSQIIGITMFKWLLARDAEGLYSKPLQAHVKVIFGSEVHGSGKKKKF